MSDTTTTPNASEPLLKTVLELRRRMLEAHANWVKYRGYSSSVHLSYTLGSLDAMVAQLRATAEYSEVATPLIDQSLRIWDQVLDNVEHIHCTAPTQTPNTAQG